MTDDREPKYVIAGHLCREYLLPPNGQPLIDVPGGNLLYTSAGLAVWDGPAGMLARVGEDYPNEWLRMFARRGFDTRGVRILASPLDVRSFQAYLDYEKFERTNPVSHFVRLGLSFPKSLLGYQARTSQQDDRKKAEPASPRLVDIPADYYDAKAAHLCPMDFMTHSVLVPEFHQNNFVAVTVDPAPGYMLPAYWRDVSTLLQGVTAFIPSEEDVRSLFLNRSTDLWEMAETLASFGCEIVVIKRGARGQMMYDASSRRRWEVPAYPVQLVDPTGAGEAFCGGFLAGFTLTLDPLQALMYGNVSASLAVEGSGSLFPLDVLPGLAHARLKSLADLIREA